MRLKPALFVSVLLVSLLAACSPQFAPTSTPSHVNVVPALEAVTPTLAATPEAGAPTDITGIFMLYYDGLNTGDIDTTASYMAEDIVIWTPQGTIEGKSSAITHWEGLIAAGYTMTFTDVEADAETGRITACYEFRRRDGSLNASGCDGVARVKAGKVVFDGIEHAEALYVVQRYYAALNAKDLDTAMVFVADEAAFANPNGTYEGKDAIYASLQEIVESGITFEISELINTKGRVVYKYEVIQNGKVLDSGEDGLTIVQDGGIVFDGTEATEPK